MLRQWSLEIKLTFNLFNCPALDRMGIDHGRSDIAVPQKLLNRADIVVGQQQMAGETVAKGMRGGPFRDLRPVDGSFYGLLDMSGVKMIPPVFPCIRNKGQAFAGEKPLPGQFLGRIFIFSVDISSFLYFNTCALS